MSGKTAKAAEVALTEIVDADIERVDGVLGPANGTRPLLMKSLPDDGRGAEIAEALAKAGALHEPFTGKHSHPHPAMDSQGGDDTHEHEHSHDGAADHGHPHPVEKAEMSAKEINDLPDDAFAVLESGGKKDAEGKTTPRSLRHYPIHDKAHADNAAARAAAELDGKGKAADIARAAMPKIKAAQKRFGSSDGETKKQLGADVPGSAAWEAQDAAALRTAAMQLADLRTRVAGSRDREAAEDEPYDWENADDLDCAVQAIECALGIVARIAFTEQTEAAQPDDESDGVAKAGRRLSAKSIAAIQAARDHLSELLGQDTELAAEDGGTEVTKSEVSALLDEKLSAALAPVMKALQAGTVSEPFSAPDGAGSSEKDAANAVDAAARQQDSKLPGQETPPAEADTPDGEGHANPGTGELEPAGSIIDATNSAVEADVARQKRVSGEPYGAAPQTPSDIDGSVSKAALESLTKALESSVAKSVKAEVTPLKDGLAALERRVEEIANQPMPGGPLLKGAGQQPQDYLLVQRGPAANQALPSGNPDELRKALEHITDPVVRDQLGRALALQASPFAQR